MRDIFIAEAKIFPRDLQVHILREKLQKIMLSVIDKKNFFSSIHFLGGTALRILYRMKRFSEDLDFSLDPAQKKKFNFQSMIQTIQKDLEDYQFPTELKIQSEGTVYNCFFKFPKLLRDLSSNFKGNEKLWIRLDVDTNPPLGFHVETSAVSNDFPILIKHYDKPSLFAGKMHAIFCRPYLKGRDIYDFIWYCTNDVSLNLTLLNNAYRQTQKEDPPWTEKALPDFIAQKISQMDLKKAFKDASFFMEDQTEKRFFDKEILISLSKKIKIC